MSPQQATELMATLGPIFGNQVIHAVIAKQAMVMKKHIELALGPVQDAETEPTTFAEVCASVYVNVLDGESITLAMISTLVGAAAVGANKEFTVGVRVKDGCLWGHRKSEGLIYNKMV